MRGAVRAEVAVHGLSRFTVVRVLAQVALALGDAESRLRDDLVEGEGRAGEILAGVAMASRQSASPFQATLSGDLPKNVSLLVLFQLGRPFDVAAMALSVVGRHIDELGSSNGTSDAIW